MEASTSAVLCWPTLRVGGGRSRLWKGEGRDSWLKVEGHSLKGVRKKQWTWTVPSRAEPSLFARWVGESRALTPNRRSTTAAARCLISTLPRFLASLVDFRPDRP